MSANTRHLTWETFRQEMLEPGLPARFTLGTNPPVWLSIRGRSLSLSTPVSVVRAPPVSPLRQIRIACGREQSTTVLEMATDREDLYREFFFLALSITDRIQGLNQEPYQAFSEALDTWKLLLQAAAKMSDDQQLGLMGELWALKRLVSRLGAAGLDAWTGPRGEPHDFRVEKCELEVKSTRSVTRMHIINGLAQLMASRGCELYLISLQWEPAGAADGRTLPMLIADLRGDLASSPPALTLFNGLLRERLYYREEDAPLYEERLRLRTAARLVRVNKACPKVTSAMISDAIGEPAARISDVTYRINLEGLGVEDGHGLFRKLLS